MKEILYAVNKTLSYDKKKNCLRGRKVYRFSKKNVVASYLVEIIVKFISSVVGLAAQMLLLLDVRKLFADYFP